MTEGFKDKLARLRRDGSSGVEREVEASRAASSPRPERPGGMPEWVRTRIARRASMRGEARAAAEREQARRLESEVASGLRSRGAPVELEQFEGPGGAFTARVETFEVDHLHGAWRLDEVFAADPFDCALLAGDEALASLDLADAIYLDTETTGLSGGSGTYVYMVGLGRFFVEDGATRFELWQGFMRGPEDERALLAEVALRVASSSGVVSFFGKSFDRHRLEDKMRSSLVEPPFEGQPHLDLFHPLKRVARGVYENCRLSTLETRLVGLVRPDDLSGAHAPEAWFDFLADRPHRLEAVFRHNRDDVLSLVTLAAWLGHARRGVRGCGTPLDGPEPERLAAIARAWLDRGDKQGALEWLRRALERAHGSLARDLSLELGDTLRRAGHLEEAATILRAHVGGEPDRTTVPACIALAKLCEHGLKDRAEAAEACRRARRLAPRVHLGPLLLRYQADLERRLARLEPSGPGG